jgi:hypothetical protein
MQIKLKYTYEILPIIASLLLHVNIHSQSPEKIAVHFNIYATHQTIHNFSASDAWACQFVGNWPDQKKNAIADWLFSLETHPDGSPRGIGLSMWRYNIGAGSADQGDSSGIKDEWRRAAFYNAKGAEAMQRVQAQNWFMEAAGKRGVKQFLGFFNSPPIQLTKNGKAYADKGICNIDSNKYKAFAKYAVDAMNHIKKTTGIAFNYISPVNEPQWDWSDGGQEGCPYRNTDIYGVVKSFNSELLKRKISSKLLITEAGHLKYFLPASDKPGKDNQIADFFQSSSSNYVGNLPAVAKVIAGHSYFSTSPANEAVKLRTEIRDRIAQIKGLEYWQSEYCILGDNGGEINGNRRDTGMKAALYVARAVYHDLAIANASAWQWWLAVSPYNYKDGLVYVDKNKTDGNYYDSKMLWAVGNYSRFIRPGMQRIEVTTPSEEIYVSAFKRPSNDTVVLVFVNPSLQNKSIALTGKQLRTGRQVTTYTTDKTASLKKESVMDGQLVIPAESIVTVVLNKENLGAVTKTPKVGQ